MATLQEHPTVKRFAALRMEETELPLLDYHELRKICFNAGADDVGFISADHPSIASQREDILKVLPETKTLISIVCRMNREPIRNPARSIANLEFHHTADNAADVGKKIAAILQQKNIRAINPAPGFPMEMNHFGYAKTWALSHKPIAVAAGMGRMGIHRNVIHPKFGNFIILATVLMEAAVSAYDHEIEYNPCLECKLCVAACPVGAIGTDGHFDFSACYTHNYREFMGGFTDWVGQVIESKNRKDYRRKVTSAESASMWQSLSYGANYKAAYCMAVCPAGEDVIGPFLNNRQKFLQRVVKPLQEKIENVYVIPHSDAEAHVTRRFPHKIARKVNSSLTPSTIRNFLGNMKHVFQRHQSKGLNAVYHFSFYGKETADATVTIREEKITIEKGLSGKPDLFVTADSTTWLRFLAKEKNIVMALLTRKIKIKGSPKLLLAFGKCFPS